jgi:Tfp pilus assembly protein PilV
MRIVTRADGFSLVETLIACVVLATALLSIGHLSASAASLLTDARSRTFATLLAVTKLEELRTSPTPSAGGDVVDASGQPASAGTVRRFDRRWSVVTISSDVRILTVVVSPVPGDEPARQVRMTGGWTTVQQ